MRMSLIAFYGRFKMNYYIYGPKDDPYHSSPHWREPYPAAEASEIRELVEACRKNRVQFVWAIHPGQDIRWNEEDYNNLLHKFEVMYDLGVRAFAIHFDDISGEGANPIYQIALLNRLNEAFVATKGDVAPLIVCPTDYTRLWANPTPRGSLVKYGESLHPSIDIFWTGDAVCSDLTNETVEWVSERVQRPILFWWNYPVTDYARHIMLQAPVYGLSSTMNADKVRGIVSNPMEYGEASKLALYSVADYAWNTQQYNAHRVGTMKLQPFYENLMDAMAARFYEHLSGCKAATLSTFGTYPSLYAPQAKNMFDNDTATYYHSGGGQRTGHYIAVDMGFVKQVEKVHILQGRNSIDDCDYYDAAILEYSLDGDVWTTFTDSLSGVYDIEWKGVPFEARYVRMRKLESSKTNWLAVRSWEINPVDQSLYHIDGNPYTALSATSTVDIKLPQTASRCVLLMGKVDCRQHPVCRLLLPDGSLLKSYDITTSMLEIDTAGASTLQIEGIGTIYEVIFL